MFYRTVFASLCFIFFGLALGVRDRAELYFLALMCGAISLTAKKKMWEDPEWAPALYDKLEEIFNKNVKRQLVPPKPEYKEGDEIEPLPPLDDIK